MMGRVLMENRNGLAVDVLLMDATGTAEREAALLWVRTRRTTRAGWRRIAETA